MLRVVDARKNLPVIVWRGGARMVACGALAPECIASGETREQALHALQEVLAEHARRGDFATLPVEYEVVHVPAHGSSLPMGSRAA
jgi:hypothetical protein